MRSLLAFTVDTFGGLDILVNNAGGTPDPHFHRLRSSIEPVLT